jgi:Asp-tRNA(Asn)/Glu-tRNA(Gln) amidotransferase A subunit family amidase
MGLNADGLPLGLQLIAGAGHDLALLELAERLSKKLKRLPPPQIQDVP